MRALMLVALMNVVIAAGTPLDAAANDAHRIPQDVLLRPMDQTTLEFIAGQFDPRTETLAFSKRADNRIKSYGKQFNPYRIVQFDGSVRRDWQHELETGGAEIISYVPHNAYIVRVSKDMADAGFKIPPEHVRWQGDYLPMYKFRESLLTETGQPELGGNRIRLHVALFRGERADHALGTVRAASSSLSIHAIRRGLDDERERFDSILVDVAVNELAMAVTNLSRIPCVHWIEKHVFNYFLNSNSIGIIQSGRTSGEDVTPLFDNGVTGAGQIIAVQDSGLDTDACQFRYGGSPSAQTFANTVALPYSLITNPENKVTTYYVLPGSDAYDNAFMHGTFVAGCAAGDNYATLATVGAAGHDLNDGMAPGAQIVVQDVGPSYLARGLSISNQTLVHKQAYDSAARIHNNSWGGYSSGYDIVSAEIDYMIWRYNDYTVVFAAGNSGPYAYTLGGGGSTAKNTVVVGATEGTNEDGTLDDPDGDGLGAESLTSFSSHGPTWDYRYKPDIVAPGEVFSATEPEGIELDQVTLDTGERRLISQTLWPNNNCDTKWGPGTSFAAPTVAGAAALVGQYFFDGYYPSGRRNGFDAFNPSGALVKAVIINSGKDLTSEGSTGNYTDDWGYGGAPAAVPTFGQGWGRVTLDDTLYFPGDARKFVVLNDVYNGVEADGFTPTRTARTPSITTGDTHSFTIGNVTSDQPLKVTLAWSDPAASPASYYSLVNDLDLVVVSPSGLEYYGNMSFYDGYSRAVNESDTSVSYWPYYGDDRNNVENVIISSPEPGNYTVRVYGYNVPGSGAEFPFSSSLQGYALVASGTFATDAGPLVSFLTASVTGGDDDAFLDPGEEVKVKIKLENRSRTDATDVSVTLSIEKRSVYDMVSPPLYLVAEDPDKDGASIRAETLTETLDMVFADSQAEVEFDLGMEEWLLDFQSRKARLKVSVECDGAAPTESEFVVDLAKNVDTVTHFDFDDGDLTEWILRQDGHGDDPPPGISECDTSSPPGRSGPKALKFGPLDDCDAEYSNNDKLVAISPPFPVALGQDLVSLNFFHRFNTEYIDDFCDVYLDRNGDGWFSLTDRVTRFSGEGSDEMIPAHLPISDFNENRTDTLRVAFVFHSDPMKKVYDPYNPDADEHGYVEQAGSTVPLGWIIDDISVTATSSDMGSQSTPLVPVVLNIEPDNGPPVGDTLVQIVGENFGTDPLVLFGTRQATVISVGSVDGDDRRTELLVLTPRADLGRVDVTVVNPANGESDIVPNGFEYVEPRTDLVTLAIADRSAAPGTTDLAVPVLLHSASAPARPRRLEFTVGYDASLLDAQRVVAGAAVSDAGKSVLTDVSEPGVIEVSVSEDGAVLSDGVLVYLVFDVSVNAPGDGTALELVCSDPAGENSAFETLTIKTIAGSLMLRSIPGDLSGDGHVDAVDLQRVVNLVLDGAVPTGENVPPSADDNQDGIIDAADVQRVVNRVLGLYNITLSIHDMDVTQDDSVAVPVLLGFDAPTARPKRIEFTVAYNPLLLTARPAVPGRAAMDVGMTVTSNLLRQGYVDVTVDSTSETVGTGELVRLVFDVKRDAPVGTEIGMVCTDVEAVNAFEVPLTVRSVGGTLTVLSWRS